MMQIKTVTEPIERTEAFDKRINDLLADGWKLKSRSVLQAPGELSEAFSFPHISILYAELEKQTAPYPEEITL